MKPSGVGGMAVMEGVMMKNKEEYAVAVRKPNNEIAVEKNTHKDFSQNVKLFKLPIFRGILAFVDSMVIGVKVLSFSASFFEDEEEQVKKEKKNKKSKNKVNESKIHKDALAMEEVPVADTSNEKQDVVIPQVGPSKKEDGINALLMVFVVLLSTLFSISFFMLLPFFVSNLFAPVIKTRFLLTLVEGLLRITIFIVYIFVISRMPEIKRFFMYHGAEHKTINCLENGFELTLENVRWQSKVHKRCGTSFMLLVMLISVLLFFLLPPMDLLWRILSRILLVPFIAGISYEFIRLAGRSESKLVNIISKPGLWMQGLTTKEPEDAMIEIAIQAVDAVFDWRSFLETDEASKSGTKRSSKQEVKPKKVAAEVAANQKPEKVAAVAKAAEKHNKVADQATTAEKSKKIEVETTTVEKQKPSRPHHIPPSKDVPIKESAHDDEDDDILKALDKYLDF